MPTTGRAALLGSVIGPPFWVGAGTLVASQRASAARVGGIPTSRLVTNTLLSLLIVFRYRLGDVTARAEVEAYGWLVGVPYHQLDGVDT
jgi:hypothetical protein